MYFANIPHLRHYNGDPQAPLTFTVPSDIVFEDTGSSTAVQRHLSFDNYFLCTGTVSTSPTSSVHEEPLELDSDDMPLTAIPALTASSREVQTPMTPSALRGDPGATRPSRRLTGVCVEWLGIYRELQDAEEGGTEKIEGIRNRLLMEWRAVGKVVRPSSVPMTLDILSSGH